MPTLPSPTRNLMIAPIRNALLLLSLTAVPFAKAQAFLPETRWIAAPATLPTTSLPIFRHQFSLTELPASATLRISGLGQYEAHLNGHNVTRAVLTPGWTLYTKHVLYDSYNVLPLLRRGPNAIGVLLGNGMYNVQPDPGRYTKFDRSFGPVKLIAELTLIYPNGTTQTISTDHTWRTTPGPITFSHVFGGEDYDARLAPTTWDLPTFNDSAWSAAVATEGPGGVLTTSTLPAIRAFETFRPVKITHPTPDTTIYDLGENFAGWPAITVTGPTGASVKLIAGELLDKGGNVTQESAHAFPDAPNAFTYTLRGGSTPAHPESWHPRFSYWGFRYVQATVTSPKVKILSLTGQFIHQDADAIGTFITSDPTLNRIHGLIRRAMLSNMVSVLTDCPHREKLGWLEQTHLAGPSLNYNWNLAPLYNRMAVNMEDSQLPNGLVPSIAPEYPVFGGAFRDSPEWGSAIVLSPWVSYQFSGDPAPLRAAYPAMQRYVAYLSTRAKDHLLDYGLGDWYDIGPGEPGESKLTTKGLTASAIYYQDLTTLAKIATIAHHPEDATRYTAEAEAVKSAFNAKFFHPETGIYDRGSQTAEAMPLALGLVPEGHQAAVVDSLVTAIRVTHDHVTAGDIGFHYLIRALTDSARSDVLYDIISRTDPPSYGAQLANGATALTEAWDANPKDSQNHFMLGHAEEWFYRGLAGIDFDRSRPTGDQIRIAPNVVGTLTSASASFRSSVGTIALDWHREGFGLILNVTVPAEATIVIPSGWEHHMLLNGKAFETSPDILTSSPDTQRASCRVKAGTYHLILHRTSQ
jgi:hypothetical protein